MGDVDMAEVYARLQAVELKLDAHLRDTSTRSAQTHDRLDRIEGRVSTLERDLPGIVRDSLTEVLIGNPEKDQKGLLEPLVEKAVKGEVVEAGKRLKHFLLWLIPAAMAAMQALDKLGVW